MNTYEYAVLPCEDRHEFKSHIGSGATAAGLRLLAENAAEDYHGEHDGWEATWPIKLVLYSGSKELGRFEVDREAVPQFHATTA